MSRRHPRKRKLTRADLERPVRSRHGLDWQACDWCRTRCQPVRFALSLICSRCRWITLYGRTPT